jgi:putative ABC transport system permease protein
MNNLRFALRQLTKSPGFTATALLTLALGIGVNTTTFSLVNALLFRLPPYRDPNRLVQVFRTTPQSQFNRQAPADIRDEIEQSTVFQAASPYCFNNANLARPGEPAERITGLNVAGNFFETLGLAPLFGRGLTKADDRSGHDDVVLVSEHFWREKLGADPKALGTVLRLDGKSVTVVGVMPAAAQDIMSFGNIDIWQPLGYGEEQWRIRNNQWLNLLGRLKPGVSLAQAQAESSTIAARLAHDYPATNAGSGLSVLAYSYVRSAGGTRQVSWIVMGLTLSVLLIACVNLANLQLARTSGRVREHAVRIALGASRAQLVRQLLAESILLSLAGGALGLLVASWGNKLLSSRISTDVFSDAATGFAMPLDYRVMGFMLLASVGTGIVFGLMPAWIASRTNVNEALKQGSRGSTGDRSKHRLRQGLVVAELALAMAALAGAAFFVRGVQHLGRVDSGWDTGNLLTGNFVLSYNTYGNNDQVRRVVDRLESQLAAIPGVDHVAISGSVPIFYFSHTLNFLIDGRAAPPRGQEPLAMVERVTPGFFTTLKYHLLAGRFLSTADRADSRQVVVINSAMAKQFWPKGDAIGHRIGGTDPSNPGWQEIVGIVNEVQLAGNPSVPETHFQMYRPFTQDPEHWLTLSVHSVGPVENLAETVRLTVARVDPDLAVYGLSTAHDSIEKAGKNMSLVGQLLSFAAALGLLLSLVGIYGVIANLALQRTQEIGIRMALGAEAAAVLWLILRNGVKLAAVGTGIGLVMAFLLTWGLQKGMPFIPGRDPALVLGLAALLVAATLFACWLPAQRATRVNPVEALRAE